MRDADRDSGTAMANRHWLQKMLGHIIYNLDHVEKL
jgi:hypothetical protein